MSLGAPWGCLDVLVAMPVLWPYVDSVFWRARQDDAGVVVWCVCVGLPVAKADEAKDMSAWVKRMRSAASVRKPVFSVECVGRVGSDVRFLKSLLVLSARACMGASLLRALDRQTTPALGPCLTKKTEDVQDSMGMPAVEARRHMTSQKGLLWAGRRL